VTRVDECTNAETGVGAAMAKGSHDLKGKLALFVIKAKKKNTLIVVFKTLPLEFSK
jgi:glucosamine 6-phosphate synthetase-like amidotransferase/phosphosugar isomerase protein